MLVACCVMTRGHDLQGYTETITQCSVVPAQETAMIILCCHGDTGTSGGPGDSGEHQESRAVPTC